MSNSITNTPIDPDTRIARMVLTLENARRNLQDCEHDYVLEDLEAVRFSLNLAISELEKEVRNDR